MAVRNKIQFKYERQQGKRANGKVTQIGAAAAENNAAPAKLTIEKQRVLII